MQKQSFLFFPETQHGCRVIRVSVKDLNFNSFSSFLALTDSAQTTLEKISDVHYRQRRNAAQSTSLLSLQQIRNEIDKKLTHACRTTDKVCQTGPPGPPGDPGALGYPGYKGEKLALEGLWVVQGFRV